MTDPIRFTLDGIEVEAQPGETIWQVAERHGVEIPHLCWLPKPGYRADGNCRACMVEIEGERVLAASCIRRPTPGMKVQAASERAKASRQLVFELLIGDQPERAVAHDPESRLWQWADTLDIDASRFPRRLPPAPDRSHPAMAVQLDACIHCNLCVRACREVQVNDVIGMAGRGHGEKIVFDFDDPMGVSTCVACGECVQACPTGALMPSSVVDAHNVRTEFADRTVDSVCPYCGVGCQLTYHVKDVIGMAGRGHGEKIVFDFDDPMGVSTCVACGECVQACPTGALMPSSVVDAHNVRTEFADRTVDSVCPYCGVGCQLTYHIKD